MRLTQFFSITHAEVFQTEGTTLYSNQKAISFSAIAHITMLDRLNFPWFQFYMLPAVQGFKLLLLKTYTAG